MENNQTLPKGKKIILFDGVCNFCSDSVNFIIKHDKKDVFRFASLQSDIGKQITSERGIDIESMDSMILIVPGEAYYQKSSAALEIARDLSGGFSLLSNLKVLPEGLRDSLYNIIARNRYKWFGKKEECLIPSPEKRANFLEI